jgi:hypothetical protein
MSISIVDIIPASQSSETGQNAEPSLAVNPANPLQMVATTFGGNEIVSGSTLQPYWISTNGGTAWSSFGSLVHFDSTLAFTQDGSAVLTAALIGPADTPQSG